LSLLIVLILSTIVEIIFLISLFDNLNIPVFSFIFCDILSITAIISLIVNIEDIICTSFLYADDIFDTKSEPIPTWYSLTKAEVSK
jgi:hypothetical protein